MSSLRYFEKEVDLKLREAVMYISQVRLVHSERFAINVAAIRPFVAVWAECDEVVVVVCSTLFPRNYVMNLDNDMAASGDGTSVACFNKHLALDMSGNWRTVFRHLVR